MANVNLSRMTVEALMDLRKRVDKMLHRRRAEIEKQLERMEAIAVVGGGRRVRGGGGVLKGRKVAPKYRGPLGENTWQAVAQDLAGLSLRSKVERNSMIF